MKAVATVHVGATISIVHLPITLPAVAVAEPYNKKRRIYHGIQKDTENRGKFVIRFNEQ